MGRPTCSGDSLSLDGMATLGHVRGRGPRRSRGRDGEVDCEIDEHRDVHLRKHNADLDAQPRKFMRK